MADDERHPNAPVFCVPVHLTDLNGAASNGGIEEESSFYRILIIWSGEVTLLMGKQEHMMKNSVLHGYPEESVRVMCKGRAPLRGIQIEYRCFNDKGTVPSPLTEINPLGRCSLVLKRLALEMRQAWLYPRKDEPFQVQKWFTDVLIELQKEQSLNEQPSAHWLEEALSYMESHYMEDLTREHLSAIVHVSPEHFSRMFKKHTGRTYSAHLTLLRIRKAQSRLLLGAPNLNTLAQEVGYKEGTYLSRKFKELVQIAPTCYQRKQKRIAALNLNHTASLLALGITPELGVYTTWLDRARLRQSSSQGHKLKCSPFDKNAYYESIAAAQPDVIVSYASEKDNKRLLEIAPVLEIPFMDMGWREQYELLAEMVEMREQAAQWLQHYDYRIEGCNQLLNQTMNKRGTAMIWEICNHAAFGISSRFGRGAQILYEDLNFQVPAKAMEEGMLRQGYVEVPIHSIADYCADFVFITSLPTEPEGKACLERLFQSEKWRSMKAVLLDQVYILDDSELFYGYDPLSSQAQLSKLMHAMCPDHKFV